MANPFSLTVHRETCKRRVDEEKANESLVRGQPWAGHIALVGWGDPVRKGGSNKLPPPPPDALSLGQRILDEAPWSLCIFDALSDGTSNLLLSPLDRMEAGCSSAAAPIPCLRWRNAHEPSLPKEVGVTTSKKIVRHKSATVWLGTGQSARPVGSWATRGSIVLRESPQLPDLQLKRVTKCLI